MVTRIVPDQATRPQVTPDRTKKTLFRKAQKIMIKMFWIIVLWFVVFCTARWAGVDTSNPAVFPSVTVVAIVLGLWLTWGNGRTDEK